jgi:4-hydroxybutyrate CoA-transferase
VGRISFSDPNSAVQRIPDGSLVVFPQGCAEPSGFYQAFVEEVARFRHLRVVSGLQFGSYPFLARGLQDNFHYTTWHVGGRVQSLVRAGRISYTPLRYGDIARRFANADVVVIHTSAPDDNGEVSLGVSVGVTRQLALTAKLVIAEVSDQMPFTCGESTVSCDDIDVFIDGGSAPSQRLSRAPDEVSSRIAALTSELVPEKGTLQIGIGAIPEELLNWIGDRSVNLHTGMITDRVIEFIEQTDARVVTGEVVGSERLFRFVHRNPAVEVMPSSRTHDPRVLSALPGFTAVNSALEVDLSGQVNSEALGGSVVSGVGGSLDFMLGAGLSPGGTAIIVLPSSANDSQQSRIVPALAGDAAVTVPRHCVDYVVTEFGVAQLAGKSLKERARALTDIAHPRFREALATAKTDRWSD